MHRIIARPKCLESRSLELHSPDGIHSCILRATDAAEGLAWFNALHSAMARSTMKALLDANRALANILGELKYIGWLCRRTFNDQVKYGIIKSILQVVVSVPFEVNSYM